MSTVPAFAIPQNHVTSDSEKVLFTNPDQEPHICLMIDNYDSFTWNIYEYLCQLGADMMVKRNDEITLEEIESLYTSGKLRSIVISPGPGHPRTDSGISRDAIMWAKGKVPVLGVCMGLECIVDVFGGDIAFAGEIVHGKTSLVQHDHSGIFHALPELLPSTRYHSLAAKLLTLPKCLQVSATTQDSGVIMGVRHREYTIEAVQYHPESVMSEGGREVLANFLRLQGGSWGGKNAWCGVVGQKDGNGHRDEEETVIEPVVSGEESKTTHPEMSPVSVPASHVNASAETKASSGSALPLPTILNRIHEQRLRDIATAESTPATTSKNLRTSIGLHAAPPVTPLVARMSQTMPDQVAVMAEIKRASPSKGDISVGTNAPSQAIRYALAGASVISVLTEPTWFKGQLSDLLSVRMALDSMPNRPALLRKDFIISTYQIDEARVHGADTVLLIVAMLTIPLLQELYAYSVSLGMEPLVEVNNAEELNIALDLGSKVIGVNNRNLHDFKVDMQTTSRLADILRERKREDVILCALSGISERADVERYVAEGVKAVLVGEALMRASSPKAFIKTLLGLPTDSQTRAVFQKPLVKICGLQSFEDAKLAHEAGADLLGLIFAKSKRQVSLSVAREVTQYARSCRYSSVTDGSEVKLPVEDPLNPLPWFASHSSRIRHGDKPLVVGVFQNQSLNYIQAMTAAAGLDIVQLHGDEPQEWARQIPVPVIKVFRVDENKEISGGQVDRPGLNQLALLDAAGANGAAGGGEGIQFDWSIAAQLVGAGEAGTEGAFPMPIILAGGLKPETVGHAVAAVRPWCVDVSSGVEGADYKRKDTEKIKAFIRNAKA